MKRFVFHRHTHHIRQEEYDGKEGQHDNGRAPVKMLIWSKDERHQQGKEKPCGCYDRAVLESHLSVMESYRRKTRLRVLSMRTRRKRKIQSLPCSPPCGRQSRQTLSMLLPLSMSGQKHDEKSIFRAIHCQLDVDCYSSASVSDQ